MDIPKTRLKLQQIEDSNYLHVKELIHHMGAVQAQDYYASLWAIGLRLMNATAANIEEAVRKREVVLTWPMRGTLHYVPAEDVRWMLKLLGARVMAGAASRHRQLEIDDKVVTKCRELIEKSLAGGNCLSRSEVYELFEKHGVATSFYRGVHILEILAHECLICFGPRKGKQPSFVLLDEWVMNSRVLDADEALAELAIRYFRSHGPATLKDFAWWSGLKLSEVKKGIELAGNTLRKEQVAGEPYWCDSSLEIRGINSRPKAHLLPAFDEYTVAYKHRDAILSPDHTTHLNAGGGMLSPVMVYGGKVIGTWKRELKPARVEISMKPFKPLNPTQKASFESAAAKYGRFLGLSAQLSVE